MKTLIWAAVMVVGFGLMLGAYLGMERIDNPTPWTHAAMFFGNSNPTGDLAELGAIRVRMRYLPLTAIQSEFVQGLRQSDPEAADTMARGFAEHIILDPFLERHITPDMLASGRMPWPRSDEVLAGCLTSAEQVTLEGRTLKVVGRLDRRQAVFKRAYLMAAEAIDPSMPRIDDEFAGDAWIVPISQDRKAAKRIMDGFPRDRFTPVLYTAPVGAGPFALYMAGMAMFLAGGSALFIFLYGRMAVWLAGTFMGDVLAVIHRWRWLNILIHAVTFGAAVAAMIVAFMVPEAEYFMRHIIAKSAAEQGSPLGYAVEAYSSGNILWAAAATLIVNMTTGTLAGVTVPSLLIPGGGVLINVTRLAVLAPALAPTSVDMARSMLPHAVTMLVEIEAYILASLLGLMVPIYLFRYVEGVSWIRRYGQAVLLNLKGLLIVFALLAAAALYEATEVILQIR
jgi:hypothetical protein